MSARSVSQLSGYVGMGAAAVANGAGLTVELEPLLDPEALGYVVDAQTFLPRADLRAAGPAQGGEATTRCRR